MPIILETKNFIVLAPDRPHHHRNNGGHIKVASKQHFSERTQMPRELYLEMMEIVRLVGEAIPLALKKLDIDVVRINYQDNGNWSFFPDAETKPYAHVHLYIRTMSELHPTNDPRFQPFPHALFFPYIKEHPDYYNSFKSFSESDCALIKQSILGLLNTEKYTLLKNTL